jgi:hypothetical protein
MELIYGERYTMERAETAARTGWTTDPVHPSRHTVAKIGLHLIEKMGNYTPVSGDGGKKTSASLRLDNRVDRKRRRDESSEEERVSSRTSRSEGWKERGRGGRGFGGRGGYSHGYGRYGDQYPKL